MSHTKQAVVLAGGLGTRLGGISKDLPKPMMDINGRPFLDYLVASLARKGINEIIFSTGHLGHTIEDYFGNGDRYGLRIGYVRESEPMGTGGALNNCRSMLDERFFVINGDTIFDVNLSALDIFSTRSTMALRHVADVARYGSVSLDHGMVGSFEEKKSGGAGLVNGGTLCLNRKDLELLEEGKSSLENDFLPRLAANGLLSALPFEGYFIDIGLPASLEEARKSMPIWETKPIAILDRDGVLNQDTGHVHSISDFIWIDGAKEAIRLLNDSGYYVVIVTNQAGIAKGLYTEETLGILNEWMIGELWNVGAHIDGFYYCPYHPDALLPEYRKISNDRKPSPGMLLKALSAFPNTFEKTFFIGNMPSDREAAKRAGVSYFHFENGSLLSFCWSIL